MNFHAESKFEAGDFARLEAMLVPKLIQAVTAGTDAVFQESQNLVAVDTGELKDSGTQEVAWKGSEVTGTITYSAPHAAFVEFGTGARGAASAGAGPYQYTMSWPGMPAQPYIRPALDARRPDIKAAFSEAGFVV